MKLTYIRYSMTIIETGGLTIVTDPVFHMLGISQAPRSYTRARMPRPDLVFISHTHLDHFDPSLLRQLPPDTPVWMPADDPLHQLKASIETALRRDDMRDELVAYLRSLEL